MLVTMADQEFVRWLKTNKLESYQAALEAEGYDGLDVLFTLSAEQLQQLAAKVDMKEGHRIRLPLAVRRAKEQAQVNKDDKPVSDIDLAPQLPEGKKWHYFLS